MAKHKTRKTPRWAPRSEGKREASIHCRMPAPINDALGRAAKRNNWTRSAELVDRLAQSFALSDTPTQAIMTIIGHAIDEISKRGGDKKTWLSDPTLFEEARRAADAAFDLLRPPGEAVSTAETKRDLGIPLGRSTFQIWWDEVRRYNKNTPIDATKPQRAAHQRRLAWLREALGSLPDRVVLWEQTGREARRHFQELPSPRELKEFGDLARVRIRKGLTREQHKRFLDLFDKAPAEWKQEFDPAKLSNPGPFKELIKKLNKEEGPT